VHYKLYDFSHYGKWCHLQVKASKHGRNSQLVSDSYEQIFDTVAMSHSRISWLESSNSQVGISRKTSSCNLHPLLLSASARVASNESQTSATLHLCGSYCTYAITSTFFKAGIQLPNTLKRINDSYKRSDLHCNVKIKRHGNVCCAAQENGVCANGVSSYIERNNKVAIFPHLYLRDGLSK